MRRRDFVKSAGWAVGLSAFPLRWTAAADAAPRRVLMFTRSQGFQHSVITRKNPDELAHAERILTELGKAHGLEVVATKDGGVFDSDLDQYDAFVFYTTGDLTNEKSVDRSPPMSPAGKERFLAAIAQGKGFVGSHCASDTFHKGPPRERQLDPDPYIRMLGGEFISHGRQQKARQVVASPDFPGLAGIGESFELEEEWYSLKNFGDDLHVILVQDTQGMDGLDYQRPVYPATWARRHEQGRVFYTSMGHREDVWTNPVFQQILLGGLAWAVGNAQADVPPNIDKVAPGAQVIPGQKP